MPAKAPAGVVPEPRRLRFVWNYLDWGGAQVYLLAIMKLARDDWDIEVLLPTGSSGELVRLIDSLDVRYRFIDACLDKAPAPTIFRKFQRQWRRIRAEYVTFRELEQEDFDGLVVHSELAPWQSWIFYWALVRRGARVCMTMHNALPPNPAWRRLVWRSRLWFLSRLPTFQILPSNQHVKESLREWVDPAFYQRMPVTYTAVDPTEIEAALAAPFDRGDCRHSLGIPDDATVVLSVGQFIDRKGRWVLLEAAAEVCRVVEGVYFVWLTPELPVGAEMVRVTAYGLLDQFKLVRSRDVGSTRIDTLRFFRVGDIFVLPSFVEGLPIALLEGMAMGLPSISTNVYAIPEAVIDGDTGLLIEAGDHKCLAERIVQLSRDAELRQRLSERGRRHVLANFDQRDSAGIAIDEYIRLSSIEVRSTR